MEEILIMLNSRHEFRFQTFPANQEVLFINLFIKWRVDMLIMEPVLTFIALNHKLVNVFKGMRLFTVTVAIKECLIIEVLVILIFILILIELA